MNLTNVSSLGSAAKETVYNLASNTVNDPLTLSVTQRTDAGVRIVTLNYTAFTVCLGGDYYPVTAGAIDLNSADVALPTTIYVYVSRETGTPLVSASTIDPETVPAIGYEYAWLSIVRMQSVGGTATVYYVRRAYCATENLNHFIGEWDIYADPVWIEGGALTINPATGVVDMEELELRRLRFESAVDEITAGAMLLSDESTTYANLELAITYLNGAPITAGKYHKMLLGVNTAIDPQYPFILIRQDEPNTEYATLDDAIADIERKAAVGFPTNYRGTIFPLAYIAMLVGDASDLAIIDLRATGVVGSGGGGGGVTDHGSLAGLGDDDHLQYSRTDGTRVFTGNIDLGTHNVTNVGLVDGIDASAHTHSGAGTNGVQIPHANLSGVGVNDHHNQSHVLAGAAGLGADHTVSGLTAGQVLRATGVATAAFGNLISSDVSSFSGYGEIYVTGGAVAQALVAATPAKLTAFAVNGFSLNATPDHANDQITVTNAGVYRVTGSFSFTTNNNVTLNFFAAVGGVVSTLGSIVQRAFSNVYACSLNGLLNLGAGNVVTVIVTASANINLTVSEGHLVVERVS